MEPAVALRINLATLGAGVEACLAEKNTLCALVLLYSAIDTSGWLDCDGAATRTSFIEWVDRYMLLESELPCAATDLYAARCGVLHTFGPNSRMFERSEARLIGYAWGTAKASELERLRKLMGVDDVVVVQVEDLYGAWVSGVDRFLAELDGDEERLSRVLAKGSSFFHDVSPDYVQELLGRADSHRGSA